MSFESTSEQPPNPYGTIQSQDGLDLRYGRWPHRAKTPAGTMLLLNGRTEFMEKYAETIDALTGRGYDVFSLDWRGQGLSSRMLPKSDRGYVRRYEDYLEDLEMILSRLVYPGFHPPLLLMAHSMGAHIALRFLGQSPHRFDRAVLIAPMVQIYTHPLPAGIVGRLSHLMTRWGYGGLPIAGSQRHNPLIASFRKNRLTGDPVRFARAKALSDAQPALSAGVVTYGWLSASYRSMNVLQAKHFAPAIRIPILVALAQHDRIVCNRAIKRFIKGLPDCRAIILEHARHEILQERDAVQEKFWKFFDEFCRSG